MAKKFENQRDFALAKNSDGIKTRKILIIVICVLIAALAFTTFMFMQQNDDGLALEGVSVEGIDISGMTKEEALAATSQVSQNILAKVDLSIDFDGEISKFTANDLGLTTDYNQVIEQAMAYGHSGSFFENLKIADDVKDAGKNFTVKAHADRDTVSAVLLPLKEQLDTDPVEASYEFNSRGFLEDGSAYTPDEQNLIENAAEAKQIEMPNDIARISEDESPNVLRYEYWQNDHYVEDYIPNQADISRFLYKGGESGRAIDMESVIDSVVSQVESGSYSTIVASVEQKEPAVTIDDLKKETQLIASWTSSFSNHASYNRNWNVAKLSGIINGVVIQPGEEWSINEEAGNRTVSSGWLEAAGIVNGGFVQQAGGGVCQISSTLYNAAIRSALEITDSTHHSISSDYIPLGLDATISSGSPDLKIKNPNDTPIYIVSYVNPEDQNITVEIYGQTVVDPTYGDVILDFSFVDGGTFGTPGMQMVYNTPATPDGTPIAPGASYVYAQARPGRSVETYIHYLSLDGTELAVESFHNYKWNPINGITYVNGVDPANPWATPAPAATVAATS